MISQITPSEMFAPSSKEEYKKSMVRIVNYYPDWTVRELAKRIEKTPEFILLTLELDRKIDPNTLLSQLKELL